MQKPTATAKKYIKNHDVEAIVLPVFSDEKDDPLFQDYDILMSKQISQTLDENKFLREDNTFTLFYTNKKTKAKLIAVVGLGKKEELSLEKLRQLGGKSFSYFAEKDAQSVALPLITAKKLKDTDEAAIEKVARALTEGFLLAAYDYDQFKTKKEEKEKEKKKQKIVSMQLITFNDIDLQRSQQSIATVTAIVNNVNLVRDLINGPPSIVTPDFIAQTAKKELSNKPYTRLTIFDKKLLEKNKMNCILGVCQGSVNEPKLIIAEYTPPKYTKTVVIIGKGVTYDSGGINLKPTGYLETMKDDMSGAAVVLATIKTAAELKLPVKLIALAPCVENMPSGSAIKPGDVIVGMSGKSIEIGNTDAEGRLILSDALHYAATCKPDYIIDLATLTGACVVALGSLCSAIMSKDDTLKQAITKASKETNEKVWELPLLEEYRDDIKSDIADLKNIGAGKGEAGSITAGLFLSEFVGDCKWMHIDIAGPVWTTKGSAYTQKGATGYGLRLMIEFLQELSKKK
ncbi:leucyl aminopeptidase [Candidatus Woesearchaeota archaeon]|nr:leucyl aminopeptidase [Candidatus Woesearchaeota archaeon]